jgi:hypothetical protein
MSEEMSGNLQPDPELGLAIRAALASHHDGAFMTRFRSRFNQRAGSWDEELAHWFWRGLAAATAATVLAGFGLSRASASPSDDVATETSVAAQLLDGSAPGADILFVAMQDGR